MSRMAGKRKWATGNFLAHYWGDGSSVDLGDVGLGDDYLSTDQVKMLENTVYNRLYVGVASSESGSFDSTGRLFTPLVGDNNLFNPLFSLGSGWVGYGASCSGGACSVNYNYSDYFSDPFTGGYELWGSEVYEIKYDWSRTYDYKNRLN